MRTPWKGRGAVSRTPGRFESTRVDLEPEVDPAPPVTVYAAMEARSILSRNRSPDIPFDQSINPYQGCEHGCVYCYARPSHSFLDLSPGIDFETRIFYKPNAAALLEAEWSRPGYAVKPIAIGANTDPYQPAERRFRITRSLLETCLRHGHPVSLISKGNLMGRDLDLLSRLAVRRLCSVAISVPTMNNALKRTLEPRVPSAQSRFELLRALHAEGVPTSLLMAPVIPAINDMEIEAVLERAAGCGVSHASYIFLRLPHELKEIFTEWLEVHMPERASHVMSLVRQSSGGRDYDNRFGIRQTGSGAYADMIGKRFRAACRRLGIAHGRYRAGLDCSQFVRPGQPQGVLDFGS